MDIISSIIWTLITVVLLYGGYRYYEFKWPENYFGPDDKPNIFLSTNPLNYFGFRVLPVLAGIIVIEGAAYKAQYPLIDLQLLGLLTGLSFAFVNDGRALYQLLIRSESIEEYSNKIFQSWLHLFFIFVLMITGLFAGFIINTKILEKYLPNINGLMDNIWAAFLTGIIFYYLYRFSKKPREVSLEQVICKSSKSIKLSLLRHIENESKKFNADSVLVKAVCIAENIERPKWFRKIENTLSFLLPSGTYGIMQVKSKKPLNDIDSISIAINVFFKNTKNISFFEKMGKVKIYNSNRKYNDLVEEIIKYLDPGLIS